MSLNSLPFHTNIILVFNGNLGILKVLASYDVTRGTTLVVGMVPDGFLGYGGLQGVCGGLWGSSVGLLYPFAFFAPLEVLYGTRFVSKHYIMVQLANVY